MTVMRVSPSNASTSMSSNAGDASSSTFARKWSSRPPEPPTTITRVAPLSRAARTASSRSLWSFSAGYRRTSAPPATAASTAAGSAESKSPTTRSTSRPNASACSTPESAATMRPASGSRAATAASTGSPPAKTSATLAGGVSTIPPFAGITRCRFHGSVALPHADGVATLSARLSRAPHWVEPRSYRDDPTGAARIWCARVPPCCAPSAPLPRSERSPFSSPRAVEAGEATPRRARAVDDGAADYGVVAPDDNGRRWIAHHRGAVEVAVTVVP